MEMNDDQVEKTVIILYGYPRDVRDQDLMNY